MCVSFFFFNDTATTEIYTLSLHDALPISARGAPGRADRAGVRAERCDVSLPAAQRRDERPFRERATAPARRRRRRRAAGDRKSTRLNSSHLGISYAVFCLKKKK